MSSWLTKKSSSRVAVSKPLPTDNKMKSEEEEKKTGLTAWLQKANAPATVKRALETAHT